MEEFKTDKEKWAEVKKVLSCHWFGARIGNFCPI